MKDMWAIFVLFATMLLSQEVISFKLSQPFAKFSRKLVVTMVFDWKAAKKGVEEKMTKSIESLQSQMSTLRTTGANPNILDRIMVNCLDLSTPLSQVARIASAGPLQLIVEPFDKSLLKEVELAIKNSKLKLNPSNDGTVIRVNLPVLTEDRRKDMVKQASTVCEASRVSVRNIRRDCVDRIKQAEKVKDIGKDESKGYQVRSLRIINLL